MDDILLKALKEDWAKSNHPKYQNHFDTWVKNITDDQAVHFKRMLIDQPDITK